MEHPLPRIAALMVVLTACAIARADDTPVSLPVLSSDVVNNPILADAGTVNDNSIYATPPPPQADEGTNMGGAHFTFDADWANRYVYRGVDHDTVSVHGNSVNLLVSGKLEFDLGKYPHPFVGLFADVYDADPVSRFQEIRPYVGADWNLRPFLLEMGQVNYIYPDREQFNQPEVYAKVTIDDSLLFNTDKPVLSPYIMGAYEYQAGGWYVEGGIQHDFVFEDYGLVLTPYTAVAWISGLHQNFVFVNDTKSTGWQHLEVGLTATYELNALLNIPRRFGEFDAKAWVEYDDALNSQITANNVVWSGVGITFKY